MADNTEEKESNGGSMSINHFGKGLSTDTSPQSQPAGSQRFALNAVIESELGDYPFPSNEESNEGCSSFPNGYIPIGKVYITEGKTVVFLVSVDGENSEIGIYDSTCSYKTLVNDANSHVDNKLNFRIDKQIDATYRLRRGCERTVYFTDDYNKPRYYNIDKPENFKDNVSGEWSPVKFNLFKTYTNIPEFKIVEVLDQGGILEPGSYNMSIQYLDEDFNPTEWITSTNPVNIYNDSLEGKYLEINGSVNSDEEALNFPETTKAIKITISNLDDKYPFYRLAFIEATAGNGLVSSVKYSAPISHKQKTFIYTGKNASVNGTVEELGMSNFPVEKVQSIEQLENRLILGNTTGKQVDFCKLQRYASRIKSDCITKVVNHSNVHAFGNTKNPTTHFGDMKTGGTGYMPGEIYSFGIAYVFEDSFISPVYHIPGRNNNVDPKTKYHTQDATTGFIVYPMNSNNNSCHETIYTENNTCSNSSYWGMDSEGERLTGKKVRHHRFPLRSEIGIPLFKKDYTNKSESLFNQLEVKIEGVIDTPCTEEMVASGTCKILNPGVESGTFYVKIKFRVGVTKEEYYEYFIYPKDYVGNTNSNGNTTDYGENKSYIFLIEHSKKYTEEIEILEITEEYNEIATVIPNNGVSPKGLRYSTTIIKSSEKKELDVYSSEILGVQFSGIEIPTLEDTNGEKIIGYYILRNEREEEDKTILDSGAIVPTVVNNKYIAHGLLAPDVEPDKLSKNVYAIIHPEHKFNGREIVSYTEIVQEGSFEIYDKSCQEFPTGCSPMPNTCEKLHTGKTITRDVFGESSYNSSYKPCSSNAEHGWALQVINRDSVIGGYKNKTSFDIPKDKIKEHFYLRAVESRDINDGANAVYNVTSDNKIGIIQTEDDDVINTQKDRLPYILFKRSLSEPYSNFKTRPFYKESLNLHPATENVAVIFNGDTYISPMRYTNSVYWDSLVAVRVEDCSSSEIASSTGRRCDCSPCLGWLKIVAGAILVAAAVAFVILTGGIGAVIALSAYAAGGVVIVAGAGLLLASAGVKEDEYQKTYFEEYEKGLREASEDKWVSGKNWYGKCGTCFSHLSLRDDSYRWIGECITNLWFESTINISLRNRTIDDAPAFLNAPGVIEEGTRVSLLGGHGRYSVCYCNEYPHIDTIEPRTVLEKHLNKKLLFFNSKRKQQKEYYGVALGEYYNVNPDYHRINKEKILYHLGEEYDCCSNCREDFPQRVHYSEQSFQEELTDNYRIFLPNNYRDLEGETGEIMNIFKIKEDLFIHTKEALWQMPKNHQERVTDQIVSFIGTGSYFEIPPIKLIDDATGSSAGTQHKWSRLKTSNGYFFVSENQKAIIKFNGNVGEKSKTPAVEIISLTGLSSWFIKNIKVESDYDYYKSNNAQYPYKDNVSNPIGTGFIGVYDSKKERVIFTKKDFKLPTNAGNDYEICYSNGNNIIFKEYQKTIIHYENLGWEYLGIENCRMKFSKDVVKTRTEYRGENVFVDIDYLIFRYTFRDGRDLDSRTKLLSPFESVDIGWCKAPSDGTIIRWAGDNRGTGFEAVLMDIREAMSLYPNNENIKFSSHAWWYGQRVSGDVNLSVIGYKGGTMSVVNYNFVNNGGVEFGPFYFSDVNIPLGGMGTCYTTPTFIGNLNYHIPSGTLNLEGSDGEVENAGQTVVEVSYIETEFMYVDGETSNVNLLNNSWTISYSLKTNSWTSFHSYIPSFYINTPREFFSWIPGTNTVWKHNILGKYQTFYGKLYQFIVEYVASSNPLLTKITDGITIFAEAKKYDIDLEQFVDELDVFFNKIIVYNSRQCSGLLNIKVKSVDADDEDYLAEQVQNLNADVIIADRNDRNWQINQLRDIRVDYKKPIWNAELSALQNEYYTDKVLNMSSMDYNKDWTELESFRDKYLVVRFIFDNFAFNSTDSANNKLLINYSVQNEVQSYR